MSVVRQQALTVIAPVDPAAERALDAWLRANRRQLQRGLARSRTTHFARWALLPPTPDEAGQPIGEQSLLAFETNFDGELHDHVADLRAALGALLDEAFRGVAGFPGRENLALLTEFFRGASRRAALFFVAHGGLPVPVVQGDAALKRAVEARLKELSVGAVVEARSALDLARELQATARAQGVRSELRLGPVERVASRGPASALSGALARPFALLLALVLAPFFEWRDERLRRRQPSFDTPELRAKRDDIGLEEDRAEQNGLTHLVAIKPGWYRTFALKLMVGLATTLADAGARSGRLGGVRSIHSARWVVLADGRLLFFSNYDGSGEALLGEFIDGAPLSLTMIWTHTIWFPKTRFLLFRGARDERAFKAWARANQVPTQVWYSAYPTLSVSDVLKNAELRELLGSELDGARAERLLALL